MAIESFALRQESEVLEQGYGPIESQHLRADGVPVTAFVRGAVVTDLGETAAAMCRGAGVQRLPLRARRTVEGICRMNDAEVERNAVLVRLQSGDARALREAVDQLGRICARLSRLRF